MNICGNKSLKYLFVPSNDTHVQWMHSIAQILDESSFMIIPNRNEKADYYLDKLNTKSFVYQPGILSRIKPSVVIFGNDWAGTEKQIIAEAGQLGITSVCIQEGCLDFMDERSSRMLNADYAFLQGPVMRNYIRRQKNVLVSGNPKYDSLYEITLPEKITVMINSNFTYGIYEEARDQWVRDVAESCRELGLNFFISQHPRDKGVFPPDYPVFKSDAFKIHLQLKNTSILISRFSTVIYEAAAMGREVIYYNPHREPFRIFAQDQTGGIGIANDRSELVHAIRSTIENLGKNSKNRHRFLTQHCYTLSHDAVVRCVACLQAVAKKDTEALSLLSSLGERQTPQPSNSDEKRNPIVSVIIPCYNAAKYLGQAIDSILSQTFSDFEIIVVDDASSDNPDEVTNSFNDPRIHFFHHSENKGPSAARNTGIRHARGKYVCFLDSDDYFLPHKLKEQATFLENYPDYGLVGGTFMRVDEYGNVLKSKPLTASPVLPREIFIRNCFCMHTTLIRRKWIDLAGFFDESLRSAEDWDLHRRLALAGCLMYRQNNIVCAYRLVADSLSTDLQLHTNSRLKVVEKSFGSENLTLELSDLKNDAIAYTHLKAAGEYYSLKQFDRANHHLIKALTTAQSLSRNNYESVIQMILFYMDHAWIDSPVEYINVIFNSMPTEVRDLKKLQKKVAYRALSNRMLSSYKDKHRGQRCVIIVNGHSLKGMDLSFLKNEITIGLDQIDIRISNEDFSPTYYICLDPLLIDQGPYRILQMQSTKFFDIEFINFVENPTDFISLYKTNRLTFTRDARDALGNGRDTVFAALQLAYFMGFDDVILIGNDHHFVNDNIISQQNQSCMDENVLFALDHFGEDTRNSLTDLEKITVAYQMAKRNFEADGRRIIDATVGSELKIFSKVDYRDIFFSRLSQDNMGQKIACKQFKNINFNNQNRVNIFDIGKDNNNTNHVIRWGNLWDESKPDAIRNFFSIANSYKELGQFHTAGTLFEKILRPLQNAIDGVDFTTCLEFINRQEMTECFVSTCTKLAQCYAKQGAWDKVKQIYLSLLNRKNLKLPEVQKQDILNVLKKLENVKIPQNGLQAEGTIFSQKIMNLRSQGKNQQAEQISNEIREKVERSSFVREPSKAKSLVKRPAGPPKRFSEVTLLLKLNYPLNRKNTLVDVGAHSGSFAKPFAKRGWQVIAFEPEPNNYKEFCCNLQSFPDVVCIRKAVFDTSADSVSFYVSSEHWGIHSLKPFHSTHRLGGTVETVRLDEVLAQSQIDYVTILKIDIEGADFMALRSFDFSRFQPEVVICEYMDERSEPNFGFTHHDMAAYMAHLGYVTFVSEYAPIVEYGRKGIASAPHKFLRCERYPLNSNPAWGNLIFVPQARAEQFEQTLSAYLKEIGASTATLQLSASPQTLCSTPPQCRQSLSQENVLAASNNHLAQYKDKHRGQRCVIIGNGPSLNKMDLSFLKNEITFGMNRIYLLFDKWDFRPTYYVSVNPLVIEQSAEQICKITSPKFLGLNGLPYIQNHRDIIFLQSIRRPSFSRDPRNGLWEGHTVTYVAMQLAYFMGFSEVILIGVDHYFKSRGPANKEVISEGDDPNHFHPQYFGKGVRWHLPDLAKSEVAYSLAKQAFEADGRRIVDATVDGHLTVFPKADYKQIFMPASISNASCENSVFTHADNGYVCATSPQGTSCTPNNSDEHVKASVLAEPCREYLVSAIVSTYNSERFFRGCLDDLEQQTIADKLEIIVVNSGSQENEEAIIREYQQRYNNIIYIKTEQREGIYTAWNRAINVAQGIFLTNANTDDRHREDALEIMAETLLANPDVALVYGDQIYTDAPNGTYASHHATEMARRPEYSRERLLFGCCVGSQPMWRKSIHDEFGNFDESLDSAGDWDFWLRISSKYKFKHIPDFLGLYYYNKQGIEHGRKIHSLYERYIVGRRYGNPYISVIPLYKSKNNPLVSVIMPVYNAAAHIAEAIESVLIQNYRNLELIIVDDGSTDNTKDIATGFKDDRIKYFYKDNSGPSAARNFAIGKAGGQYIIPLDADDMMTPDSVARHLMEFENHSDVDLVYSDVLLIDDKSCPIRIMKKPEYQDRRLLIRDLFRAGYPILPFRLGIRRSVFDKIGFYDEDLLVGEDYDMMRRFIKTGLKAHHLNEPLHLRRMHADSLSRNYIEQKVENLFEILKRFVDTFTYDELFPDVAWEKIPVGRRQLHAKCLVAATYLSMAQFHVNAKSSPFYIKVAFEKAWSQLNDCMKMDPNNYKIRELMDKCELGRKRHYQQVQQVVV